MWRDPETFGAGIYIVMAGSAKKPCLSFFKDGEAIFSECEDGVRRRVQDLYTTWDNDINGEQLYARQQERKALRTA